MTPIYPHFPCKKLHSSSMEIMAILFRIFLLFPLLLSWPSFISSAHYVLPDKYFINCGSESNATFGGSRVFVGDVRPGSLLISPGKSETIKDDTVPKSIPEIYHTARVYKRPTWYVFRNIDLNGTYVVRLHFFPLSSKAFPDLGKARFDVWDSSGFPLLSNFSLQNSALEKIPAVKEFAFEVKEGPFGVHFSPSEDSTLAFVNAIEIFLAPDQFKPDTAYPISPELRILNKTNYELVSKAFKASYRINVGGSFVSPDNDTLWRTWLPDDGFLETPAAATNISYDGKIQYGIITTVYTAPELVYISAKEMIMESSGPSNLTWAFEIRKKTKFYVHLHWCYIMNEGNEATPFDYFIGSNRTSVGDSDLLLLATPLRYDGAIVSDSSGVLEIGIAPNVDFPGSRPFLNAIEIMELIDKSSSGPIFNWVEENKALKDNSLFIGLLVGGVLISTALVIGLILFYFKTKKARERRRQYKQFLSQDKQSTKISITDLAPDLDLDLKVPFAEIREATKDFDEEKVIGVGGFGKVYQGTLRGKEVAVKRSRPGFGQGMREFQTEIIILSQIRHRYLVSLYGYCDENEEMILVYEFMEKGTLRQYLYGSKTNSRPFLTWKQRLQICIDAAKGLDYLHRNSAGGVIIHRDIKTTNILLDGKYMAKVADFGISKSGVPDPKEIDTTIRGTYGYLDPEYFNTGQLKETSDVYSFGVVLFEVLSGRAPIVQTVPDEEKNLAEWAALCISKGEVEKLVDPFLVGTIEENSLRKFVEVAGKCVSEYGAKRPSMRNVVYDLQLSMRYQDMPGEEEGKGFDESIIGGDEWEIPSTILDRIPSRGLEDSMIIDNNDSTTVNARELAAQFKIDYPR